MIFINNGRWNLLANRLRQLSIPLMNPLGHFALRKVIRHAKKYKIATQDKNLNWKYTGIYLDTRINYRNRLTLINNHYSWLIANFPYSPISCELQSSVNIWRSSDKDGINYSVAMRSSSICRMEGEIELLFKDNVGELALLTFIFIPEEDASALGVKILIGGLQGGSGRREHYRRATKGNGEVTPMNLLVLAVKALADAVGATCLLGMCHEGQIARAYADDKMYRDYDRTWTELGGAPQESGYFALDFRQQPDRSLNHLSRAHRARAGRKMALKAQLHSEMRAKFLELMLPATAGSHNTNKAM